MTHEFVVAKVGGSDGVADLIFVHGITGDKVTTWTTDGQAASSFFWPKQLSEDNPSLNVYSLGYPASLFEKWAKKEMTLYERGKASLDYLASLGFGQRPMGFIAHSLGGLLVKQMLRTGVEATDRGWNAVAERCRLVVFLSTPHTGASLANALEFVFPRISSHFIGLLRSDSSELDQLNAAYRRLAAARGIKTVAYYEKYRTKKIAIVVARSDADPGVADTEIVPVDADHISICKPTSRAHPVYAGVHRHVTAFAAASGAPSPAAPEPLPSAITEFSAFVYAPSLPEQLYFVLPFDGSTIFRIPVKFCIMGNRTRTVRKVHLTAELSDGIYLHDLPRELDKIAGAREIQLISDQGENEYVARVLYKIGSIPPGTILQISDFIFANKSTILEQVIDSHSRDEVSVAVKTKTIVSFPVAITLDGEDMPPWSGEIRVHFRRGHIDDFVKVKREENRLIKEIIRHDQKVVPHDAMVIGFRRFATDVAAEQTIATGEVRSAVAARVRVTPRGMEAKSPLQPL